MSRRRPKPRAQSPASPGAGGGATGAVATSGRAGGLWSALDVALLVALASLLGVRPLISETFLREAVAFLDTAAGEGPTPATTAWLDALLLLTTAIAWWRRPPQRWGVVGWGLALLTAAVVASAAWAQEPRLAINAGANLVITIAAGIALFQLARALHAQHVLICVLLAVGSVNATKCVVQNAYEFEDTIEVWLAQKERLAETGADLNAQSIRDYENRLRSAEAFGYLTHPNVTAAALTLAFVPAVGFVVASVLGPPGRYAALVVAGAISAWLGYGVWLTGSLAGLAAAGAGAAGAAGLIAVRRWRRLSARRTFALLVGAYVALIVGVAGWGLVRGTLPGASLAFRWQYWTASAAVIVDAPLTGVGRENFQTPYLRHKEPAATEEVRNPHNRWVGLLAELGPAGLVAGALLCFGALACALRALDEPDPGASGQRAAPGAVAGVLIGLPAAHALFSATPFDQPGVAVVWSFEVVGVYLLSFGLAYPFVRELIGASGPRDAIVAGLALAIFADLLHGLVGFQAFTAAGLATLALTAAAAAALGAPRAGAPGAGGQATGNDARSPGRLAARWAPATLATAALLTFVLVALGPTARASAALRRLGDAPDTQARLAAARAAVEADPLDADLAVEVARRLLAAELNRPRPAGERLETLTIAGEYAQRGIERAPRSAGGHRLAARVAQARASALAEVGDTAASLRAWSAAARHWDAVVAAYPSSVRDRIAAAEARFALWQAQRRAEDAEIAREHIRAALAVDALREPDVTAKLNSSELDRLEDMRRALSRPD